MLIFLAACVLTGGSARPDMEQLLVLRPVAVLALMVILLTPGRFDWTPVRVPLILLGLLAVTVAVQLIPLPPSIWMHLPGRENYAAVVVASGVPPQWHPIAVDPDLAWNSLLAILIPVVALAGFAGIADRHRSLLLPMALAAVAASAVLGILQIAAGNDSIFYMYRVMNPSLPDGFLANRNHAAVFFAMGIVLLRAWTLIPLPHVQIERIRPPLALCLGGLFFMIMLMTGSRSGLVAACIALIGAFLLEPRLPGNPARRQRHLFAIAAVFVGCVGLLVATVFFGKAFSIDRLFTNDIANSELRLANWPALIEIIRSSFPFGTGFGSFAQIFTGYESEALLRPTYFNNAHNDLLELMITGGVPALLVALSFLVWLCRVSYRAFASRNIRDDVVIRTRTGAICCVILLQASITDYPLRTPLMAAFFAIFCAWLGQRAVSFRRSPNELRPAPAGDNAGCVAEAHAPQIRSFSQS